MKNKILFYSFLILTTFHKAWAINPWKKVDEAIVKEMPQLHRGSKILKADYFVLDIEQLKTALLNAPFRELAGNVNGVEVDFPVAYNRFEKFSVYEAPVLHPELAAKYPQIKTYVAKGITDPTATIRLSITQFGVHAYILSGKHVSNFIDPYTIDRNYYAVYAKDQVVNVSNFFNCLEENNLRLPSLNNPSPVANINDQKLRKYRLAQSCNAEYGNIFATNPGTEKADIQAQMAITINRVNGVYERDLGITLEFVPNNDLIIYFGNVNADPWTNEFNTKTAQVIDAAIGVANYDIGHNFNTSGGGSAGCIGCVCTSQSQSGTHKGRGYTGSTDPTGDPFDIDYVAHEMGHQFGGYHVMNTCSRSGSGSTEVEPASGSSIMGYAGICSSNVQNHSHDDFNYVNIRDISTNVKTGASSGCAAITNITNQPPTADAGLDYVIPKGTAFILEGQANDPDGNQTLTYNWCQNDPAQAPGNGAPVSTWTVGPLYRAIPPSTLPYRYMPNINTLLNNQLSNTWEVTPTVGRTLNFSFIVRDNDIQGGQTASDLMKVTVDGNSGPFVVTSHNTSQTINAGTPVTVTWNVANTNSGAVNCQAVDILFSIDSGYTYPVVLAAGVPNNGSATFIMPPSAATTKGRLMVRGSNNIFFDLNNAVLTVQAAEFIVNPVQTFQGVCPSADSVVFELNYNTFLGFADTAYFSVNGLPSNFNYYFNPSFAFNDSTPIQLIIKDFNSNDVGDYNLLVTATAGSITKNAALSFSVLNDNLSNVNLIYPADTAIGIPNSPTFSWQSLGNGTLYDFELSDDNTFTNILVSANGLTSNTYQVTGLNSGSVYYWRVKASNACSSGPFYSIFSFTTNNCNHFASTNVPVAISATGTPTINSTLSIPVSGIINDINVIGLKGSHTYIRDLTVKLISPANTTVTLFDRICGSEDNFDVNFDDEATSATLPCPPIGGGTFQPNQPLSAFNGQDCYGTWRLQIKDNAAQDGGSLTGWGLNICYSPTPLTVKTITVFSQISPTIFPNPTQNNSVLSFTIDEKQQVIINVLDVSGKVVETISKSELNSGYHEFILNRKNELIAGVYLVQITGERFTSTQKLIIQ